MHSADAMHCNVANAGRNDEEKKAENTRIYERIREKLRE